MNWVRARTAWISALLVWQGCTLHSRSTTIGNPTTGGGAGQSTGLGPTPTSGGSAGSDLTEGQSDGTTGATNAGGANSGTGRAEFGASSLPVTSLASLGAHPVSGLQWPAAPRTNEAVTLATSDDVARLFNGAQQDRTRFLLQAPEAGSLVVSGSDVEIVVSDLVHVDRMIISRGAARVTVRGGTFGQIDFLASPISSADTHYVTDLVLDRVRVISRTELCPNNSAGGYNPYPNECFGISGRGVRRFALLNSEIRSLVYAVALWPTGPGLPSSDVILANNILQSTLGVQATVRIHDTDRSLTQWNRLANGAEANEMSTTLRHNYRVHGRSTHAYATRNLFVNSGVMIGEGGGDVEEVQHVTFQENRFHQTVPSLFQMGVGGVSTARVKNNTAFSNQPSHQICFYCPVDAPATWEIDNPAAQPFVAPPSN